MNYELINGYGIEDPGFELLRQVAQKYCPEELQQERAAVIPDESLNLSSLAGLFQTFVGADVNVAPTESGEASSSSSSRSLPVDNGFGIGIPETEKLRSLHYDEVDTLNSEEIKRTSPYCSKS